jgi:hypothetical protein
MIYDRFLRSRRLASIRSLCPLYTTTPQLHPGTKKGCSLEGLPALYRSVRQRELLSPAKLTCFVATADGRGLVAIGCAEGVWIGLRHDSKCESHLNWSKTVTNVHEAMRRVLHLKLVTQCAMLEDFGIFLVLADKVRVSAIPRRLYSSN